MSFRFTTMPVRFFIASLVLISAIFLLEMVMPVHTPFTLGYVIVSFYLLQFPQQRRYAVFLGIITTIYVVLSYFIVTDPFKDEPSVVLNRGLSVLAVWLPVYFSLRYKKIFDNEARHRKQLGAIFDNANTRYASRKQRW